MEHGCNGMSVILLRVLLSRLVFIPWCRKLLLAGSDYVLLMIIIAGGVFVG